MELRLGSGSAYVCYSACCGGSRGVMPWCLRNMRRSPRSRANSSRVKGMLSTSVEGLSLTSR